MLRMAVPPNTGNPTAGSPRPAKSEYRILNTTAAATPGSNNLTDGTAASNSGPNTIRRREGAIAASTVHATMMMGRVVRRVLAVRLTAAPTSEDIALREKRTTPTADGNCQIISLSFVATPY